ncbi:hypothetical protein L873DRAFT_42738 [Choiromyces venosus 120613-1]|uniref:Uncharacterized protein n=1 Tax=Choiromyces venosus 120613-1 TaxID=1336337 RepID=A0A3N4KDM5_9PEZI|nr:hypothetical protein L873DRAFT_42738 [Choiromyces venosus 120613-1]
MSGGKVLFMVVSYSNGRAVQCGGVQVRLRVLVFVWWIGDVGGLGRLSRVCFITMCTFARLGFVQYLVVILVIGGSGRLREGGGFVWGG